MSVVVEEFQNKTLEEKAVGEDESFEREALFNRIDRGKDFGGFERQSLG